MLIVASWYYQPFRIGSEQNENSQSNSLVQLALLDADCQDDPAEEDNIGLVEVASANSISAHDIQHGKQRDGN